MIILGIDPGSVVTGFGLIEHRNRKNRLLQCGCIRPGKTLSFPRRLLYIYDHMRDLVAEACPHEVALESVFYGANTQSLIKLCQARGAIVTALANSDLPIAEYAPREVKRAVVGRGGAAKEQVQFMIQRLFGNKALDQALDATDAVAIALCHAHQKVVAHGRGTRQTALIEKIEGMKQAGRAQSQFDEKLKAIGVNAKSRRRLNKRRW